MSFQYKLLIMRRDSAYSTNTKNTLMSGSSAKSLRRGSVRGNGRRGSVMSAVSGISNNGRAGEDSSIPFEWLLGTNACKIFENIQGQTQVHLIYFYI